MATVIIKGYIYAIPELEGGAPVLQFCQSGNMGEHGWVLLGAHEINAKVPDGLDVLAGHAASLARRKQKALEELEHVEREFSLLARSPAADA